MLLRKEPRLQDSNMSQQSREYNSIKNVNNNIPPFWERYLELLPADN